VQLAAVSNNSRAIRHIKLPSAGVLLKAIQISPRFVFESSLSEIITPEALNAIHPDLSYKIEIIKALSENKVERVMIFTPILKALVEKQNTKTDAVELPVDIGL
jgi:hypothetical protein